MKSSPTQDRVPASTNPTRLTRRQAIQTAVAATVFSGFGLTSFRRLPAQSSAPQGLALCIGLNFVDADKYAGWRGDLAGCVNDANRMLAIADAARVYDKKSLINEQATIENVRNYIGWAARDLRAGDLFILSCSSHGGQRVDTNGDESDGMDETWCLFNGQWSDDDRYELFSRFATGVRILLIGDMCHSGTTERAMRAVESTKQAEVIQKNAMKSPQMRSRAPGATHRDFDHVQSIKKDLVQKFDSPTMRDRLTKYRDLLEAKPIKARDAGGPQPGDKYGAEFNLQGNKPSPIRSMPQPLALFLSDATSDPYPAQGNARSASIMSASGLLLSACQDHQTALDGDENGLFTQTLLSAWQDGRFQGNYDDLFTTIKHMLSNYPDHQPNREPFGNPQGMFSRQRPFSIAQS